MKILIIKSSSMGDVVHALPVAFDIAQHFPDAVIDWVAEESFRDIPRLSPFVGDIIQTAFRRWRNIRPQQKPGMRPVRSSAGCAMPATTL